MKYDMSYRAYRNRSRDRREELRAEYMRDTGREYFSRQEEAKARALKELAELGIPFDPDDWPFEDIW